MASLWVILPVILLLYLLHRRKNILRPLGPIGLPLIGHLHLLGRLPHRNLHNLARKHGPIMSLRFGSIPIIVVSSPTSAELVLKTHDLIFATKPRSEAAMHIFYGQRDIAFGPYGPYWRDMRKLCTFHLLNDSKIVQFGPMRRAEIGLLVTSLKRAGERRESVDLTARVSAINGAMIFLMVFGGKYSDTKHRGLRDVLMEAMECLGRFNVGDYFWGLGGIDVQGLRGKMVRVRKELDGVLEKIVDDHGRRGGEKKGVGDIVDTMMEVMEEEGGYDLDRRHVKAVLLDMLIAGIETTSTAIEWVMSELMRHPTIMKKLQNELESVVGLDKMVEESHLPKLKYLDCTMKEALRLHPPAPFLIHESMEDCKLDSFHIQKGSMVMVNVWAIGMDPEVWPNPESFTPERFNGGNIDVYGRNFELLPFGSGRRGCAGIQLGLTMMKLVVAQLVHCFDWELIDGMRPIDLDMSEHYGIVTSRANHLLAIPKYRLHIS